MRFHALLTVALSLAPWTAQAQPVCDSLHTILGSFFEHQGMMFSVVATAPVTIDHLSANLFPGTRQYTLHKREGGYVGHTDDPSAWIALDTVMMTSANTGFQDQNTVVVPIPLDIAMVPGDTISFFLTDQTSNGLFSFGNFTPPGNVVESDANIGITVAYALPRTFGPAYGTYEWSGRVSYCPTEEQGIEVPVEGGYEVSVSHNAITVTCPAQSSPDVLLLELRDLSGRSVGSAHIQGGQAHISTHGLAAAPYLLTVVSGSNKRHTRRVIVP